MYKEKELVIAELKQLFDIENNITKGSYEDNGKFAISKMQMSREEVMQNLSNYFFGVGITNGYLMVDPITFVHTTFKMCDGDPNQQ